MNVHQDDLFISDAPTLLVGLGGLGCYLTNSIYHELPEEQKKFVQAVIIDTDAHELKDDMYEELRNDGGVIQTSPNEIVKACVKRLGNYESVKQWFPVSLLDGSLGYKQMPEGAAQIRGISRLAMLDTINSNRIEKLNRKLEKLLVRTDKEIKESCRIIIINSIAGGTGSGCFLQVALYIRAYLDRKGITNATIRSFIVMPEIFIANGDYASADLKNNVRANGYAALKEIDAVIKIRNNALVDEMGDKANESPFHPMLLEYEPNETQPVEIKVGSLPFDVISLIDYTDIDGNNIGSKVNYISQAKRIIKLHVFSPLVGRGGIASQTDNLANTHIANQDRSRFAGAGEACIEYPVDDIVEYGALRWATDGISNDWLEIDAQINDEIHRIEQLKKEGVFGETPDPHKRFGELIREKCEVKKPTPFYRGVYNDAFLLNEKGERTEEKSSLWLQQIKKRIDSIVSQAVSEKGKDIVLAEHNLQDHEQVENTVYQFESRLERYYSELEARVQSSGLGVAKEVMWKPYQGKVAVLPQQEIQLNTWLLAKDEPMHPMAMRYFLVESIQKLDMATKRAQADMAKQLKQIEAYALSYDLPETEDKVETAVEAAKDKAKLVNRFKGELKRFAEDYAGNATAQKSRIESYARSIIEKDCYETLLGYLLDFADMLRIWFSRLEKVVEKNQMKIADLAVRHEKMLNPTVRYVYGSKALKEKLWDEQQSLLANKEFPADISKQIYVSLYEQKGRQYIDQLPPKQSVTWVQDLFNANVLGWCRQELYKSAAFNMNISSAIKQETKLMQQLGMVSLEQDASYALQTYINQLNQLAKPLVNLVNENKGEAFNFICLHPQVNNEWSETEIDRIVGSPFVNKGFSKYKISKLTLRYGLVASDLSDVSNKHGTYRQSYDKRIAESRAVPRQSTSPHLDDNWDSPAFLPEMNDAEQVRAINQIYHATLINLAYLKDEALHPVIFAYEYDMTDMWHWSPIRGKFAMLAGTHRQPAKATLYNLVDVLAVNFHLVDKVIAQEAERVKQENLKPEQSAVIKMATQIIQEIHEVTDQAYDQTEGSERQKKLLIALFGYMHETIFERYPQNTAQSIYNAEVSKVKDSLHDIGLHTSERYQKMVTTTLDSLGS